MRATQSKPSGKTGRWGRGRGRPAKPPLTPVMRPDGSRDVELPLMDHLRELRNRLVKAVLAVFITTMISLIFAEQEVGLLAQLAEAHLQEGQKLIALKPTETFIAYIKVAFITGLAMSMPLLVYQLFQFVAPGLTKREKRLIIVSLPAITLLFVGGVLFCYFIVLPSTLGFLLNFGSQNVENTPTISEFLSFVTRFLFAMGVVFETPLIVFLLAKLGVATPKRLRRFRRWAYVLAFILAAIITPTPDPVNQIIVAVPIIILYEFGALLARVAVREPKKTAASPSP